MYSGESVGIRGRFGRTWSVQLGARLGRPRSPGDPGVDVYYVDGLVWEIMLISVDPGSGEFALVRERLIVPVGAGSGKLVVREARSEKLAIPVRDRSGKRTAPAGARGGRWVVPVEARFRLLGMMDTYFDYNYISVSPT